MIPKKIFDDKGHFSIHGRVIRQIKEMFSRAMRRASFSRAARFPRSDLPTAASVFCNRPDISLTSRQIIKLRTVRVPCTLPQSDTRHASERNAHRNAFRAKSAVRERRDALPSRRLFPVVLEMHDAMF